MIIILSFFNNYNQTQNYHSLALASKSNRYAIMIRSENMLIELNALLSNQMVHENHIYLNVGKSSIKEPTKKVGSFHTIEEIKQDIKDYPSLPSNQQFMKLFHQIIHCEQELLEKTILYNQYVAQYNTLISHFPLCLFKNQFKLEALQYFKEK